MQIDPHSGHRRRWQGGSIVTMHLQFSHQYNGSSDRVVQLMRNPEFIADIASHAGARAHKVRIDGDVANLEMELLAPESMSKFLGRGVKLSQRISWGEPDAQGVRTGTMEIDVKGAPVKVDATGVLSPTGEQSSRAEFEGDLNVKIPLVGKKLESQVLEPMIRDAFAAIERRTNEWLARE